MIVEFVLILTLIVANGVFSMSEAALISARKARLQQRANEGDSRAKAALTLAGNPNSFLATVQIGITLIGVLTGAFSGVTIATSLAGALPFFAPYSEAIAFALVVALTTYLSLVIGELVPKQLALNRPEAIVMVVAKPMYGLSRLVSPLVGFLNGSTNLTLRLMGVRPSDEPAVTEEEVKVLIEQGTQTGTFEQAERDLLGGVLRLDNLRVGAIMTPRTEVTWLDENDPPDVVRQKLAQSGRSRFPVARGSLDNVIGVVRAKDLLSRVLAGEALTLSNVLQPPLFVPDTLTALRMLTVFQQNNTHIALVMDEYGGLRGIVTLTDVLEEIVGGGRLSEEASDPQIVRREDGAFLLDGLLPVEDLIQLLPALHLPDESEREYETLAGFLLSELGQIPATGDKVEVDGLRFEIVDMDGHRIDRVLVVELPAQD